MRTRQKHATSVQRGLAALLAGSLSMYGLPLYAAPATGPISPEAQAAKEPAGASASPQSSPILLNVGAIDTASPEAAALRGTVGPFEGKRLHLVQFAGPTAPQWYKDLEATGVEVIQYIPYFAYLVYGDAPTLAKVQEMARASAAVRWDGAYLDRYKVQPRARAEVDAKQGTSAESGLFEIQLVQDPTANAATLKLIAEEAIEPVRSRWQILKYVNLVVGLPVEAVARIAARPDVVGIDRHVTPEKFDERQDLIVAGQLTGNGPTPGDYMAYLAGKGFTQAQFTTSNFVVDVSDSGIDNATTTPNHFGLRLGGDLGNAGRVAYNRLVGTPNAGSTTQGCDGHGTLNAHIVAGNVNLGLLPMPSVHADASGFRYGLGVAPFVKVGSSVIFDPDTFTNPNLPNLQSSAYNDNARVSTNSWGANVGGAYNLNSQTFDALVRDAQPTGSTFPVAGNQEMVIVFSSGNSGPGANTTGAPGTAKNVITVGASEGVQAFGGADQCLVADSGADSANDMIAFSSRGPTDDGRIKPELVAPGTHISGGVFQATASNAGTGSAAGCFDALGVCAGPSMSNFFPTTQQFYTASSGTSHSTPAVAGGAALIRQHFINLGLALPSPAMTKALLVNSARYMNGVGANDTLPSNGQGMGMMNLDTYFTQLSGARILRDQVGADMFTASGQQRVITGLVANTGQPVRVTLAWTDAPGPTVGNSFINNLDLEVTVGGTIYKGNVFSGPNSVSGGSADPRNNMESVTIPAGASGPVSVRVVGTNIAGNGVPNVGGALDQDYALVVSNVTEVPLPVIAAGAASILAESCTPNGFLDPNETVTMSFCLSNTGTLSTVNAIGTLQATGGVTSPSGPQNYGVVVAGGPPVCRDFTFTVGSISCATNVVASIQVQDGADDLGTPTWTLATGVPNVTTTQNFDAVSPPALPAGWTSVSGAGADTWTTVATTPDTAPNAAFINDPAAVSDTSLVTPNIAVPVVPGAIILTFRNFYNLEASGSDAALGYDGGVLELKIGAGAFQDVITAGGTFISNGYNRTISTCCSNPLAGRQAWSGNSGGYLTSAVQLPAAVSGQTIQLRWRRATDTTILATGWRVDTISLQVGRNCCVGAGSSADLSITKTDGQTSYIPGQPLTYTIVVSNAGPDGATGATVTDTFPADLTGVSWTCVPGPNGACGNGAGTGNINETVNLLSGGSVTFTVNATASLGAAGDISNTASVAPPGGVTDPTPGNNSATDTDTRTSTADLGITKTDGQATAVPGQTLTYTIVATNAGLDAVVGATVTDVLPGTITGANWTCVGAGGGICTAAGAGNINDSVTLPVGGSVTYTLTGTLSSSAVVSVSNTASIAPPGGVVDPVPANDSATDTDLVLDCDSAVVMVPDGRLATSSVPPGGNAWFGASVRIGNSYSVEFKNVDGSVPPGTLTLFSGDDGCVTSTLATRETTGIDPSGDLGAARQSFTATGTLTFFRARLVNGSGSTVPISFSWSDTTLFSAAWSDVGAFNTFYSFQNTTGATINGTLILRDTTGTVVSTSTHAIPAGQTVSTNTATLGIPRNLTGTATFTHDGPPGAVSAEAAIANFSLNPAYVQPVKFQSAREAR